MKTLHPPTDDHFQQIYNGGQTHHYDAMVLYEDVQNNLLKAIRQHALLDGKNILDVGAGTGRVSRLLDVYAGQILSVDLNIPMLKTAQQHQRQAKSRWYLSAGDAVNLPVRSAWADVAVAGWALGHFNGWFMDWITLVDRAVDEMRRTLKPDGIQIIIETMGTGFAAPAPPTQGLAAFYERLEKHHGFTPQIIRTDYVFPDVKTAVELVNFFFGAALAQQLNEHQSSELIEWTGVWWRQIA